MTKILARSRDNKNSMNGITDLHATWLDQDVSTISTPTFSGLGITNNLIVGGDLTVNGNYTSINTEVLVLKDNLIEINSEEVGPGVTVIPGISGLQVNRGSSVAYQLVFRESDDSFCVGEVADLQVVATREDNPLNNGIMIFNDVEKRLDSVTTIPLSTTFSSNENSTSSSTGTIRVNGGIGLTGNIYTDGGVYIKGTDYTNYINSDISQNLLVNTSASIHLNSTVNVKIPTNIPLIFSSASNFISSSGSNLTAQTPGIFSISGASVNLQTNSPLIFGTSTEKITYNGTNLVIDAANLLSINPQVSFNNSTASTSNLLGSVKYSGGMSISNTTDAVDLTNGGTITTAGGVSIAKKLFVGGVSTFENTTDSTSVSTGSLVSLGGVGVAKNIYVAGIGNFVNTSDSTSVSTGSLVSLGGVGIAKKLFVGGVSTFENTTDSTNISTGSLVSLGGVGIAKNIYVGGIGNFVNTGESTSVSTGSLVSLGGIGVAKNIYVGGIGNFVNTGESTSVSTGSLVSLGGVGIAKNIYVGGIGNFVNTTESSSVSSGSLVSLGGVGIAKNIYVGGIGNFVNTEESTSVSTGSLVSLGGIGVAKNIYVGGIGNFVNTVESTSVSSGSLLSLGGVGISKSLNVGYGMSLSNLNFSNSPGHGKLLNINSMTFTDNITEESSSTSTFSSIYFGQVSLAALNTSVTTTNSYTVYIQGPPIQGTNQSITSTYSLYVNSGASRLGGDLTVTGSITLNNNLTMQGTLDVNGHTLLDRVTIVTDDGVFSVSGLNAVNINVAAQCTMTNTVGNILIDSQAGILYLDGNNSINMNSTGPINITPGASEPVNLQTNSPLVFGTSTEKITYNGTNLVIDASNLLSINPQVSFNNSTSSTSSLIGSVKYSGGISISNSTDAINSTNGGTITTAGGVAITKKLFVGGVSTFENIAESSSISVLGGVSINKKIINGSNYSGDPESTSAVFFQTTNSTFTDNVTAENGTVNDINFNAFMINTLSAVNTGISTTTASTLYIEGCPVAGTNQTITNCYAIHVDSGITRLDGDVQITSTNNSTSLVVDGGVTINKNLIVNSKFDVGANINSSPSTSGVFISLTPRTVTDNITATSGTATEMLFNVIGQPTLASTNSITTTDTATFVIQGAPLQGLNQTLTNSYALWIKSGDFRIDGDLINSGSLNIINTTESTSTTTGSITTLGGVGITKNLHLGGIGTFENTDESTNVSSGSIVTLGGIGISKSVNVGYGIISGYANFSNTAGKGKLLKTNTITFTDNSTAISGTALSYSSVDFGQVTLAALNTSVTTTNSYTVYIEGPPLAGLNQTLTNSYSLFVGSGNTRLNGNLSMTGSITLDTNLTMQGTLDVNGHTLLDRVTIVTDDGQFDVSGSNAVNINVAAQCTVTNTAGNITVDSQAGTLFLDGNNSISLNSLGAINYTSGASSGITVSSGTLTITAPTLNTSSSVTSIQASTSISIGTTSSGIPITIGHSISETIIGDNLTVTGNFTVQGTSTILDSTVLTTQDNAIIVNSLPAGISDGGILIRRYQTPNNTSLGEVITDTPTESGAFQNHLILDSSASIVTDYYKGWWIKITSGAGNNFVRRIKSSNSSRVITLYETADNTASFVDGLDLVITILTGDTYQLFPGTNAGIFYNESLSEFSLGNVPFDTGAGVFPLVGYRNLHVNRLFLENGIQFAADALFDSQLIIDITNTQSLLVRKNADSGDVFYINTTTPSLNLSNPVNTIGSSIYSNFLGNDSIGTEVVYSKIESKIKDNTIASVNGELSLIVSVNSVLEAFIVMDGNADLTTINSLVYLSDTTGSTSSTGSFITEGGITSLKTTDATSATSGGSLTTLGGASVGKKLYVGSDMFVNASGLGSGIISIAPTSTNGQSSVSFYGDTSYSGQLWTLGHGLSGSVTNSFSLYNSFTTSLALSVDKTGFVSILSNIASTNTTTGALVITGGLGVGLDLNVGGNITGTWNGTTISVGKGGTGATSFTLNAVLLGNTTSAIQSSVNMTYSSDTLSLPKITSTDSTDSSSSITGSAIFAGGVGIAKKIYIGTDANIAGNIILSSTDSTIGKNTVDSSDNGSISIFGGGAISDTRGASILLKGNEHSSIPGSMILTCGNVNSTGYLSILTSSTERVRVSYDGITTFQNTLNSTSNTAGAVVISGGLAVNKDVYIGGDLYLTGALPGGTSVTTPTLVTSNLVNITSSTPVNTICKRVYNEVTLSSAFIIVPSATISLCTFEVTLPIISTNFSNVYDVIVSVNGHLANFTPIENKTSHAVTGTTKIKVYLTSGPSTANHYIHIIANYTTN